MEGVERVITCECGVAVVGQDDDELISRAQAHIADAHPALVGTLSREDLLAIAEEL